MVVLRPAVASDAGEVLTLQRAAWLSEGRQHDTFDIPPLTQTLDEVRAELDAWHALVAVDAHRIVGTARARELDGAWFIGRLGVVPDRQGEGLGRLLLGAIEDAAPPHLTRFALITGERSTGNIAFYQRAGYALAGAGQGVVRMQKPRQKA